MTKGFPNILHSYCHPDLTWSVGYFNKVIPGHGFNKFADEYGAGH